MKQIPNMLLILPWLQGPETSYTALKDRENAIPDAECKNSSNIRRESLYRRAFYTLLMLYVPLFILALWLFHQIPHSSLAILQLSPQSLNECELYFRLSKSSPRH